jgi:hypothetical protein
MEVHVGLCASRHPVKRNDDTAVDEFVFDTPVDDVHDFDAHYEKVYGWMKCFDQSHRHPSLLLIRPDTIYLYVTGLTPLFSAFLHCWRHQWEPNAALILMHYDRESNTYKEERW